MSDAAEALQLGSLAYADDRLDEARHLWEQAFEGFKQQGDSCAAARVATLLSALHSASLGNRATGRGWHERARRLLDDVGPCVEWGYWELAGLACDRPDVEDLAASADRARQIAVDFGDRGLEVRALADGGLALVSQGKVREGFQRLDEALAALTGGLVQDPFVIGTSLCALLSSCDRAGDVDRATEWIRLVHALVLDPLEGRPKALGTHCKIALGGVLSTAGRWTEAEAELVEALARGGHRGHHVDAAARLAEVWIHQGRTEEAARLLEDLDDEVAAAGAVALLHLDRAQHDLAAGVLHQGIRRMVGDVLRSAPLAATLVEVELARGRPDDARAAADLLRSMANAVGVPGIAALADLAEARLTGDPTAFERAISTADRPVVVITARVELAAVLAVAGDTDAAVAEARAAHAAAGRLGATRLVDRAAATLRSLGAAAPRNASGPAVHGLTPRETEVLEGLRRGDTNAEIAARLYLSPKTVEHHVGRVLAKLGVRTRAEAAALAAGDRG